jgi:hypothetical protein
VPIAIFSLTNAIKFGTSVYFSCIIIALGVIGIIGDNMEHTSCLFETILERALESQRTKGTAEELLRLYLIGKRLYYTPAEELLRLR